jgi:hypothetical protein
MPHTYLTTAEVTELTLACGTQGDVVSLHACIMSHISTSMFTTSRSKAPLVVRPALLSSTSRRPWADRTESSSATTLSSALMSTSPVANRSGADIVDRNDPKSVPRQVGGHHRGAQLCQRSHRRRPDTASGPGHDRDGSAQFVVSAHR